MCVVNKWQVTILALYDFDKAGGWVITFENDTVSFLPSRLSVWVFML